ncbi:MAG: rubredoxin [Deltaproteobacteria bacterium]|nr:rubredoxin [Deltaproteobacteria bacterium]
MATEELRPGVHWVGVADRGRREFDGVLPIPAGTTYNAYLVRGQQKTALVDTVEPTFGPQLLAHLQALGVESIDYVVSNHAEQDHSGSLPAVLERYATAKVLCTAEARRLLADHLDLPAERIDEVGDGSRISLGGRTLQFLHAPWTHWPETMVTWLEEDRVLFSCDLFGSHLAGPAVRTTEDVRLPVEAKRYFAAILMPYRDHVVRALDRFAPLPLELIAPSHGPVISDPKSMLDRYREWAAGKPRNLAVLPFVSMHGSTRRMIEHLAEALAARDVEAEPFDLSDPDLGGLALALVDAATIVLGAPAFLAGAHPKAVQAAFLINCLRPKARYLSMVGSYGWGGYLREQLLGQLELSAELLEPVVVRGAPRAADFAALDRLADAIAAGHESLDPPPPVPRVPGADSGARHRCKKCGWVYDPAQGDPKGKVEPGTAFEDLPEHWYCPLCGASTQRFKELA